MALPLNDVLTQHELREINGYLDSFDADTLHEVVRHIGNHPANRTRNPHKREKLLRHCLHTSDCALLRQRIIQLLRLTYIPGSRIRAVHDDGLAERNGAEFYGEPVVDFSRKVRNEVQHALDTCDTLLNRLDSDDRPVRPIRSPVFEDLAHSPFYDIQDPDERHGVYAMGNICLETS
ncbi:MAG: hypothetical protein AAB728_01225 [Patescibacteria group bacterium]